MIKFSLIPSRIFNAKLPNEGSPYQLQLLFSIILSKKYPMQPFATITLATTITIPSLSHWIHNTLNPLILLSPL